MIQCGKCGSTQFELKTYPQGNELNMDISTFNNTVNIQYEVDTENMDPRIYCKGCGEIILGATNNNIMELIKGKYTLYGNKMNIR